MTSPKPPKFLFNTDEIKQHEGTFSHPWNTNSHVTGTHLSELAGLKRSGISIVRVPAGKESFVYHSHYCEEEWIYIISGRGIAEIDDQEYEVGPGYFMGFPTPSVAHHLRNPFDEELTYLMGGENHETEIADFPRLGRRMVRRGGDIEIYDVKDKKEFGPL